MSWTVIERKDASRIKEIDKIIKNKFRWEWLEKDITTEVGKKTVTNILSDFIRKIDRPGKVICTWCNDTIDYGGRGFKALDSHAKSKKHCQELKCRTTNYSIAGTFGVQPKTPKPYGLHPFFTTRSEVEIERLDPPKQPVPVADRVGNYEAMVLGFLAENSLPFTMAPKLVGLSKELARDPKALNGLSMDRTSASYKMKYGLAETLEDETLKSLRLNKFSMNIDESTSNNLHRVLCILVSYYSPVLKTVVVEHLTSLSVIRVDSQSLFQEISDLMSSKKIPWTNLVSVLMDSCNVMRGSKSGVETRLRGGPAPHLLDVDGDSCHHIHNATSKFCKPFAYKVEGLHSDIFSDFKWSTDLRDALKEICFLTGVPFTMPERFVNHRWLSNYDVSMSNLRLWDIFTIFYYAFLTKEDKALYMQTMVQALHKKDVSTEARGRIREILSTLSKKNMTEEGKGRKKRICEKIFYTRLDTLLTLNFYCSVLPLLKNYVMLFESKTPLIHKLHDKQLDVFRRFLSCFVKPEALLEKKLKCLDVEANTLRPKDIFYGYTSKLMKETKHATVKKFQVKAMEAYVSCAKYLQKKLPLENKLLEAASAIDPLARGHSKTLGLMRILPSLITNVLSEDEVNAYELEIRYFQVDTTLPPATDKDGSELALDAWWTVVFRQDTYPALSKIVKALLSCFHGPQVEGAFNTMGDVLHQKACRMDISTYSAIQTVKYALRAKNQSAVQHFSRKDITMDPVNGELCFKIRTSSKKYREHLEQLEIERESKRQKLAVRSKKEASKAETKRKMQAAQKFARKAHVRALQAKKHVK